MLGFVPPTAKAIRIWGLYLSFTGGVAFPLHFHCIREEGERTGLVVRASDSGSGDPGSILGRVVVLFP